MKKVLLPAVVLLFVQPALAEWKPLDDGVTSAPSDTNSTIQAIVLHCVDGAVIDVYSGGDGTIRPLSGGEVEDFFYKPGFIRAVVDDQVFPIVAAGSGDAVVLFSEGEKQDGYQAPLDPALVAALGTGELLTLNFDLNPTTGSDGSTFESFASFDLTGGGQLIRDAIGNCQ
ncbi:hypothetical protein [Pseudaminobacter salicylatoxidans]|uniref:hypothetical protein n=1 Tax=Pseudaminobacter salicylatoxidans TaxID=93369 RepID=UPI0002FFEAEF|nr:hypothetical protein [Pseudaminobacter salicylatoxidans]